MAFCGQCGLLLNTNTTTCPRCGTQTEFDAATPGTPVDDNSATVIAHTDNPQPGRAPYTPLPPSPEMPSPDATKAVYYPAPGGNTYPGQRPSQSGNSYPTPGTFEPGFAHSGSNYPTPGAQSPNIMPSGNKQAPAPGMYQPGVFPITDPGYPFQPPMPPRKTNKGLIIIIIVLIVALLVVTGMLFALGSNPFAGLFGAQNTPLVQSTPTGQPVPTTSQSTASAQSSPTTTQSAPTPQTTPTTEPTQQAQATIQQYYADINSQDYQDAYNLWVSYPDTYNNFKQGFAHTHHDAITLGETIVQTDGTIQVNLTVQATEDATGGGTHVSTYQGYYTVGQQADGSWKIINGQLG